MLMLETYKTSDIVCKKRKEIYFPLIMLFFIRQESVRTNVSFLFIIIIIIFNSFLAQKLSTLSQLLELVYEWKKHITSVDYFVEKKKAY